ncbi:PPOX class F420-dependent oxidoreductase [Dactylosporangium sp. NPDC051541]|uniref:PPOX class F420-dependent oxidoreductase n=1 Tax=Dactylosporangium sp. NPDC051541 TaxID=3363977 RepID=UPI0037BBDB39
MTNTPATVERLSEEQYLLVTTFRRDGTPVPTPVWAARDGEALMVWTVGASGKVKRIRNNGHVTVAPCTVRGKPTGDEHSAQAEVLGPDGAARARELMKKKYGLQGRLVVWTSVLRRGKDATVGVRITLD